MITSTPDSAALTSAELRKTTADNAQPGAAGVIDRVELLWSTWRELALTKVEIAAVELRQAGLSLATMLAMAVALGSLVTATWLFVLGLILYWSFLHGVDWRLAGVAVIACNVIGGYALVQVIRSRSDPLLFKTLRSSL